MQWKALEEEWGSVRSLVQFSSSKRQLLRDVVQHVRKNDTVGGTDAPFIRAAASSADGSVVLSTDCTASVRHGKNAAESLHTYSASVSGCAVSAGGRRAATASMDGYVRLWELPAGACVGEVGMHHFDVHEARDVAMTEDGRTVVAAFSNTGGDESMLVRFSWGEYDEVTVWSKRRMQCLVTKISISDGCCAVAFTTRCGERRQLHVANLSSLADMRIRLLAPGDWHADVCAATRAPAVAVADGSILRVLHAIDPDFDISLSGFSGPRRPTPCAISADGRVVVAPSSATEYGIWDMTRGAIITRLQTVSPWTACAISADAATVAAGCSDGVLKIYKIKRVLPDRSAHRRAAAVYKRASSSCVEHSGVCAHQGTSLLFTCTVDNRVLRNGDHVMRLPCGHVFHTNCIIEKLYGVQSPVCPIDNQPVFTDYLGLLPSWIWRL